jgi:uncharacterized protein YecT (DUF1311 family)
MVILALLLPAAAMAQDDWLYAPMVASCYAAADGRETATACIGQAAGLCMADEADGETTQGMAACLAGEAQAWDQLLNSEYATARQVARQMDADDGVFTQRADQVQVAQRAWIAFRDANCAMQAGLYGTGSLRVIAAADCQMQMTAAQTIALRDYHSQP